MKCSLYYLLNYFNLNKEVLYNKPHPQTGPSVETGASIIDGAKRSWHVCWKQCTVKAKSGSQRGYTEGARQGETEVRVRVCELCEVWGGVVIWVSLEPSRRELSNEYQYEGACVRVCEVWGSVVIWVSLESSRRELSNEYQYEGACV